LDRIVTCDDKWILYDGSGSDDMKSDNESTVSVKKNHLILIIIPTFSKNR
jgi:hypothetical protein